MGELFPGKRLKKVLGLLRRLESYNSLIFTTDVKISVAVVWNGEMRLAAAFILMLSLRYQYIIGNRHLLTDCFSLKYCFDST